ncbi:uncharacterized protein BDV14DRAFT_192865 [Aspergillus stella-maris]|uniref:uncharacterized protein n=1 Tax=Aspergillus stella-maris TaxID=1810926 RepID=UPI003CCDE992
MTQVNDGQLAQERISKFRGTARVYINEIVPHPSIARDLDPKNVKRLSDIFTKDQCRRLDIGNHITGVVSEHDLAVAIQRAGVTMDYLRTCRQDKFPLLHFELGQLQCLHGQHRLAAGKNYLVPMEQWWTVDIYLNTISPTLLSALVDEYSNEKVPSDGEVFLKVRQYQGEGNSQFEKRWISRLSPNKAKRLRQLSSRLDIRAAFDRLRTIPALLIQGMKLGSIPRVLATSCDEEIVHALDVLLKGWSQYLGHNTASMLKLDPETIDRLQGMAPGISSQDAIEVEGLVLSGAVFSKFTPSERRDIWDRLKQHKTMIYSLHNFFQDMWFLEACAHCMKRLVVPSRDHPTIKASFMRIYAPDHSGNQYSIQTSEVHYRRQSYSQRMCAELGYRQLWLYAHRHYPKIPRESEDEGLLHLKSWNWLSSLLIVS